MRPIPAKASGLGREHETNTSYLIPPTALTKDQKVLGQGGGGMVRDCFLLAYAYLGRCPRLVCIGPLALKSDHIQYHHTGIRYESKLKRTALHFDDLQDGRGFYFVDMDILIEITSLSDACLQMQ